MPTMAIRTLGVYLGHDPGACLIIDGQVTVLIEEERLNRFKHGRPNELAGLWPHFAGHFGYFPWASVAYCLRAANIGIDDLDSILVGDRIWAAGARETIQSVLPTKRRDVVQFVDGPLHGEHHYHHALGAFLASPFESAAVLVIDGDGSEGPEGYEAESGYLFQDRRGSYRNIFKNRYTDPAAPRSGIGWTYEQVTLLLGFSNPRVFVHEAGKTMGLASYGKDRPEFAAPWIEKKGGFSLGFNGFKSWFGERRQERRLLDFKSGLARGEISQYAKDLAWKAQGELEEAVLHLARELKRATGAAQLCFAGGVALNSVCNGRLVREKIFDDVFLLPGAHDGGQSLGLAYRAYVARGGGAAPAPLRTMNLGRSYSDQEIAAAIQRTGLDHEKLDRKELLRRAARELAEERIIGWFQGGSEFGPRALGHRSILANPCPEGMRDTLNARVKFREGFRPFAPAVLADRAHEVFETVTSSPYMMTVAPVREAWRKRVTSITHVDGSARLQTVRKEDDAIFYDLIAEFHELTGVPLVVNTSFNLRGMPIVESPRDALQCFVSTEMDALYLGDYRVAPPQPRHVAVSWTAGLDVEVLTSAKGTFVRATAQSGKVIKAPIPDWFAPAVARVDGRRTVADLCDRPEALLVVQRLAREKIATLLLGREAFGDPGEDLHWWQQPQ